MLQTYNHTSCVNLSNTAKAHKPSTTVVLCETRIVMRSGSTQPIALASPIISAELQLTDAPLPGTMKFNDAQTAYCKTHTCPEVSIKVRKLVMLSAIAYDQEKAGLHFEGRRSFAEAEINLLEEELTQTSQAACTQNPLSYIGNTVKAWVSGLGYYFEAEPTIENLYSQFSSPIGDSTYKVRKSTALSVREAAGETISNIGVGLIDSHHDYISVQKGIAAFLDKHFNSARNDIFLAEAVMIFEEINGKEKVVAPSLEKHHEIFCMGIPLQSCRFLKEPEKEVAELSVALLGRRKMVNRIFEFLMKSIPLTKANEARKKLAKHNQAVVTVDTEIKVQLMIEYQKYCDLNKQKKLIRLGSVLEDETKKENAAHAATNNARDEAYLSQITKAIVDLKPGAKLYYLQGINHFRRLSQQLNRLNTFFIDPEISSEKEEL